VTDFVWKQVARECGGQRYCLHGITFTAAAGVLAPSIPSADASIAAIASAYVLLFIFVSSQRRAP
jgi:hypothetical protein